MKTTIAICGGGPLVVPNADCPNADCPNAAAYEPQPTGYVAWHQWAGRMARIHTQRKCDGCGLHNIWVPFRTRKETT